MLAAGSFLSQTLLGFLVSAALLYYGGKGFLTGKVSTRGGQYDRTDNPVAYWIFTLGFLSAGVLIAGFLILR